VRVAGHYRRPVQCGFNSHDVTGRRTGTRVRFPAAHPLWDLTVAA
jgi:hypothetical protein